MRQAGSWSFDNRMVIIQALAIFELYEQRGQEEDLPLGQPRRLAKIRV